MANSFVPLVIVGFLVGGLVRRYQESDFYDCCMEEAYEGGLC